MSFTQFYNLFDKDKSILKQHGAACFASFFNLAKQTTVGKNLNLHIYHFESEVYKKMGKDGVTNEFSKEDRLLFLSLVREFTGVSFTDSEVETAEDFIDYGGGLHIKKYDQLVLNLEHVTSYIQLKAAVTLTRYLIEDPYSSMLKESLEIYKQGVIPDFFQIMQEVFYKTNRSISEHCLFPPHQFWGIIDTPTYLVYLTANKPINSFGEVNNVHQRIFNDRGVSNFKEALKTFPTLQYHEYAKKKKAEYFELTVI